MLQDGSDLGFGLIQQDGEGHHGRRTGTLQRCQAGLGAGLLGLRLGQFVFGQQTGLNLQTNLLLQLPAVIQQSLGVVQACFCGAVVADVACYFGRHLQLHLGTLLFQAVQLSPG